MKPETDLQRQKVRELDHDAIIRSEGKIELVNTKLDQVSDDIKDLKDFLGTRITALETKVDVLEKWMNGVLSGWKTLTFIGGLIVTALGFFGGWIASHMK